MVAQIRNIQAISLLKASALTKAIAAAAVKSDESLKAEAKKVDDAKNSYKNDKAVEVMISKKATEKASNVSEADKEPGKPLEPDKKDDKTGHKNTIDSEKGTNVSNADKEPGKPLEPDKKDDKTGHKNTIDSEKGTNLADFEVLKKYEKIDTVKQPNSNNIKFNLEFSLKKFAARKAY